MMKFRDEQGNIVTPQRGDYVLESDIKDEAMHDRVREAFGAAGCKISHEYGNHSGMRGGFSLMWDAQYDEIMCNHPITGLRRIIPTQQTLFEAACAAEDGARFKIGLIYAKMKGGVLYYEPLDGPNYPLPVSASVMAAVEFEQLPSGPKKRDTEFLAICEGDGVKVPFDCWKDCADAFKMIGRLMQWEGARIGRPGYVMCHTSDSDDVCLAPYNMSMVLPVSVTFQTAEQCEAAWRDVCPEMFGEEK